MPIQRRLFRLEEIVLNAFHEELLFPPRFGCRNCMIKSVGIGARFFCMNVFDCIIHVFWNVFMSITFLILDEIKCRLDCCVLLNFVYLEYMWNKWFMTFALLTLFELAGAYGSISKLYFDYSARSVVWVCSEAEHV